MRFVLVGRGLGEQLIEPTEFVRSRFVPAGVKPASTRLLVVLRNVGDPPAADIEQRPIIEELLESDLDEGLADGLLLDVFPRLAIGSVGRVEIHTAVLIDGVLGRFFAATPGVFVLDVGVLGGLFAVLGDLNRSVRAAAILDECSGVEGLLDDLVRSITVDIERAGDRVGDLQGGRLVELGEEVDPRLGIVGVDHVHTSRDAPSSSSIKSSA
jgi:hypothetical protein